MTIGIHLRVPHHLAGGSSGRLAEFVTRAEDSGLDGLTVGDHVSFRDGTGYDGLIQATALASLSTRLRVWTAVYLLALRHPVTVARQIASLSPLAAGRFTFGVGLGGDDRHELEVCGVDPRRRGRRLDASLDVLRALLVGESVTVDGEDFSIPGAVIRPIPDPPVPIVVGGRSDAALRRAGRVGDGWLSLWLSPARVTAGIAVVAASADEHGRGHLPQRHAYTVWCGLDRDRDRAREMLSGAMEALYHQPFGAFERYSPCGPPGVVADTLRPYVDAGIDDFVVIGVAADDASLVGHTAELAELLRAAQS